MTTNKPEVFYATNLYSSAPVACLMRRTGEKAEPVIRLSDYEDLQAECEKLRKDADRIDWLADPNNSIGNVQLPMVIVRQHLHSLRDAIDAAMESTK